MRDHVGQVWSFGQRRGVRGPHVGDLRFDWCWRPPPLSPWKAIERGGCWCVGVVSVVVNTWHLKLWVVWVWLPRILGRVSGVVKHNLLGLSATPRGFMCCVVQLWPMTLDVTLTQLE